MSTYLKGRKAVLALCYYNEIFEVGHLYFIKRLTVAHSLQPKVRKAILVWPEGMVFPLADL